MDKKYRNLSFLFIFLVSVINLYFISNLPISADEAYLWVCSKHPSLCYYDTPPFAPFMIMVFTKIFGDNEFGTRFFAVILGMLTCFIIYLFTKKVSKNDKYTFFSVLLFLLIPGFSVSSVLCGVEAPLIFFYILTVYFLYVAILKKKEKFWYFAGISAGIGFLSKYLILFIFPGISLYILFKEKKILKTKYPYLSFFIFLLFISPVIIWNAKNQWANFILNFFSRQDKNFHIFPSIKDLFKYFISQAGVISPFVLIVFCYVLINGFKKENFIFLIFFPSVIIGFFILYSLFVETPAPHWSGIAYLPLIVITPSIIFTSKTKIIKFFYFSIIFSFFITFFLHIVPFSKDIILKLNIRESTKRNFESFLLNWPKKLSLKVYEIKNKLSKNRDYFILARGFSLASYIEFYYPENENIYMIFQKGKAGHSYYFWQDINKNIGKNAIFIDENTRFETDIKNLFYKIERLPNFEIFNEKGEILKSFVLYNCISFKGMEKELPPVLKKF